MIILVKKASSGHGVSSYHGNYGVSERSFFAQEEMTC